MKKIKFAAVVSAAYQIIILESAEGGSCFDGLYGGVGVVGGFSNNEAETVAKNGKASTKANSFGGTLVFGSGKGHHQLYWAGEFVIDLAKVKRNGVDNLNNHHMVLRQNGIWTSFGFRVGWYTHEDVLYYAKIALSHGKCVLTGRNRTDEDEGENVSVAQIVPAFSIGLEKKISQAWSVRSNVEYRCRAEKADGFYTLEGGRRINVRVMFVHHSPF
ncbi:MAG: hypothetical protein LBF54_03170 [Holosporaceae bacterium]|jgi:hypothetical protein|nr:hypothetical protein [Holosporaceae bacterium]